MSKKTMDYVSFRQLVRRLRNAEHRRQQVCDYTERRALDDRMHEMRRYVDAELAKGDTLDLPFGEAAE